ncbi:MAG TPA: tRNA (adenosine(37)-N6)-threonylcarbamoyltransferase complex dimerization subunit type 1 TsaB [Hyphomicrobium sp.]|nr:tRNA (adenosine(37)-N6)-threonylcarbamoyltransferase complex dimerization subunit type 1 TsaB [Hyphomicrobium sp.]
MNILALDTCFDACSVAVGRRLRSLTPSISYACEPMVTGHVERLMPMIEMAMAETGMAFSELQRIAIATGPGTFTGARIAVSAARALALATGATIVTVSSLELMAMNPVVATDGADVLAIATDARRGEVYFQSFHPRTLKPLTPPQVLPVADAASLLARQSSVIAGSGADAIASEIRNIGGNARAICQDLLPEAIDMLFVSSEWPATTRVAPLYLRPPDAKPPAPSPYASGNAGISA